MSEARTGFEPTYQGLLPLRITILPPGRRRPAPRERGVLLGWHVKHKRFRARLQDIPEFQVAAAK